MGDKQKKEADALNRELLALSHAGAKMAERMATIFDEEWNGTEADFLADRIAKKFKRLEKDLDDLLGA